MEVRMSPKAVEFYKVLPDKDRRIVQEHLQRLESYPDTRGDMERLKIVDDTVYRLHIGRKYTAFYRFLEDKGIICVYLLMTIEQAHKKYRHIMGG